MKLLISFFFIYAHFFLIMFFKVYNHGFDQCFAVYNFVAL